MNIILTLEHNSSRVGYSKNCKEGAAVYKTYATYFPEDFELAMSNFKAVKRIGANAGMWLAKANSIEHMDGGNKIAVLFERDGFWNGAKSFSTYFATYNLAYALDFSKKIKKQGREGGTMLMACEFLASLASTD